MTKVAEGEEGGDEQEERTKSKRGRGEGGSRKRAKLDSPDGQVWCEVVSQQENSSQGFLYGSTASTRRAASQLEIRGISGMGEKSLGRVMSDKKSSRGRGRW